MDVIKASQFETPHLAMSLVLRQLPQVHLVMGCLVPLTLKIHQITHNSEVSHFEKKLFYAKRRPKGLNSGPHLADIRLETI